MVSGENKRLCPRQHRPPTRMYSAPHHRNLPRWRKVLTLSWNFQKEHWSSQLPPRNRSPNALGNLVRAPTDLNHHSTFFFPPLLFLLHSCVQFSVLGVFKGTFILGPGFSSFMVIQLPPRAKECLKSLNPAERVSNSIQMKVKSPDLFQFRFNCLLDYIVPSVCPSRCLLPTVFKSDYKEGVYMSVCVRLCLFVCLWGHVCVCLCVYMSIYVSVYVCVCLGPGKVQRSPKVYLYSSTVTVSCLMVKFYLK